MHRCASIVWQELGNRHADFDQEKALYCWSNALKSYLDTLNQTRIEIKYLCSIVNDLRERLKEKETEISRLENVVYRGN